MKRTSLAAAAVAVLTSIVTPAQAQLWLRDARTARGPGIRTGGVALHPGIGAEIGYDSNYFNRSTKLGPAYPVVDTVRLRITPSFYVATDRARATTGLPPVTFSVGGAFIYSEFLTNTERLGRSREYGAVADLLVSFLPGRPIGVNVFDNFTRTAQPSLEPDVTVGLNRIDNRGGGEVVYTKPGGLFDWRVGYAFGITRFESGTAQALDSTRHEIYTRGRYRFLPRTALIYDGNVTFFRYENETAGLSSSTPVRTRIGLNGLLTDRVGVQALVGWASSFYDNAGTGTRDFDSVIGQVEGRYFFTGSAEAAETTGIPFSSAAIGFVRNFSNSYIGNFVESNRFYANVQAVIQQRFFLSLTGGVAALRYGDVLGRTNGALLRPSFSSVRADASAMAEYRLTEWLAVNTSFQYLGEFNDANIPVSTTDPTQGSFSIAFSRYQIMGGLRAFY